MSFWFLQLNKYIIIFICQAAVRIIQHKEIMILQMHHQEESHLKWC